MAEAGNKTVANYAADHIGKSVTKLTFARIFKEAWESTVKVSTVVNLFQVYIQLISLQFIEGKWLHLPCTKLKVSKQIPPKEVQTTGNKCKPNEAASEALEKAMGSETRGVWYEEGYDLETDELYVWSKFKTLSIKDSEKVEKERNCKKE